MAWPSFWKPPVLISLLEETTDSFCEAACEGGGRKAALPWDTGLAGCIDMRWDGGCCTSMTEAAVPLWKWFELARENAVPSPRVTRRLLLSIWRPFCMSTSPIEALVCFICSVSAARVGTTWPFLRSSSSRSCASSSYPLMKPLLTVFMALLHTRGCLFWSCRVR